MRPPIHFLVVNSGFYLLTGQMGFPVRKTRTLACQNPTFASRTSFGDISLALLFAVVNFFESAADM